MPNDSTLARTTRPFTLDHLPQPHRRATTPAHHRPILLSCIVASGVLVALLMERAGLSIDPADRSNLPFCIGGLFALGCRLFGGGLSRRHGRVIADTAGYYATFTVIALTGAVASYPIAALTHGFHDATLQRIDAALGFDWVAWYETIAGHRSLQILGLAAYRSIYLTPAVLLGYFAWIDARGSAQRFLATFWLAAVVTLALYAVMPAVGPFSYLWHGAIPYMPESEQWQQGLIPALRGHEARIVDLGHLRGLVSAPSFHTAAAVIYIHTAWPIARLRKPVLLVNIAMLLATPVEGTHYLSDMILGALVAWAAIVVLRRVVADETAAVASQDRIGTPVISGRAAIPTGDVSAGGSRRFQRPPRQDEAGFARHGPATSWRSGSPPDV